MSISKKGHADRVRGIWGYLPGDIDIRLGCIWVKGTSAQFPLGCVAVETLALEKAGDGQGVGGWGRHWTVNLWSEC